MWLHIFFIIIINIITLTFYHYVFNEPGNKRKFYTSNARIVLNNLYKKAVKGEIDLKMFESILNNMEKQLREQIEKHSESVVFVKEAVVMGAEPILFDQAGNIIFDPEKKKEALIEEKKIYKGVRNHDEKELDDAIREFKENMERENSIKR